MPCLEWSAEEVEWEQGSGPKGPMSCRTQGWISLRPSVLRRLGLKGQIWVLIVHYSGQRGLGGQKGQIGQRSLRGLKELAETRRDVSADSCGEDTMSDKNNYVCQSVFLSVCLTSNFRWHHWFVLYILVLKKGATIGHRLGLLLCCTSMSFMNIQT